MTNNMSISADISNSQATKALQSVLATMQNFSSQSPLLPIDSSKLESLITHSNKQIQHIQSVHTSRLQSQFEKIIKEFNDSQERNWSAHENEIDYLKTIFLETNNAIAQNEISVIEAAMENSPQIIETLAEFYRQEIRPAVRLLIGRVILQLLERSVESKTAFLRNLEKQLLFEASLALEIIKTIVNYFSVNKKSVQELVDNKKIPENGVRILAKLLQMRSHFMTETNSYKNLPSIPVDVKESLGSVFISPVVDFIETYHNDRQLGGLIDGLTLLILAINMHDPSNLIKAVAVRQKIGGFSERIMILVNSIPDTDDYIELLPLKFMENIYA